MDAMPAVGTHVRIVGASHQWRGRTGTVVADAVVELHRVIEVVPGADTARLTRVHAYSHELEPVDDCGYCGAPLTDHSEAELASCTLDFAVLDDAADHIEPERAE